MGIILGSLMTEKANIATEKNNVYSFFVRPNTNKITIKNEIKKTFGVDVSDVRTLIVAPKVKVKFTKSGVQIGKSNKLKKAIIKIAEGQQIDLFAN
jgi:large subunit ribosomal protein L23